LIVVEQGPRLLLIVQTDHARFSAELLSLWRADALPLHPRRQELLFSVREHDNGWREADAAPRMDPVSAKPYDFLSYPDAARQEIWGRGIYRFADRRPYTALLIARHANTLLGRRFGADPEWRELRSRWQEDCAQWLLQAGLDEVSIAQDYEFLHLADTVSLAVCNRWSRPFRAVETRGHFVDGTVHLEPFPLAGATTFQIPYRHIANRRYAGDADLGAELARARWSELQVRVAPF
jgi:hypothetical protein